MRLMGLQGANSYPFCTTACIACSCSMKGASCMRPGIAATIHEVDDELYDEILSL